MFRLLSTSGRSNTPTFENDPVDLQIKSLLYVYRRLRISRLVSFSQGDDLQYTDGANVLTSDVFHQKLDATYNIDGFKQILLQDEHRVLVDYHKNKFRALCLVEEYPSANISRPISYTKGGLAATKELNGFPVLLDENQHSSRYFKFELLPLKVTPEFACEVLVSSDIYIEHRPDWDTRMKLAIEAVKLVLGTLVKMQDIKHFTQTQRAAIIRHYLKSVAVQVQITRIYEDLVNREVKPIEQKPHILASPGKSPVKSGSMSPNRTLKANKSIANLHAASPPKMSARKSIADLRQSSSLASIPTLRSEPSLHSNAPLLALKQPTKTQSQLEIWEKSLQAVKIRLARERQLLAVKIPRNL